MKLKPMLILMLAACALCLSVALRAQNETPLTDAQLDTAIAVPEVQMIEQHWPETWLERIGWTLATLVVVTLAWAWLCSSIKDMPLVDTDGAYDRDDDALRESFDYVTRRRGKRLHISRLNEDPMKLKL